MKYELTRMTITLIGTNDGRTMSKTISDTDATVHDIVYPELSYRIMGLLFDVHNKLGTPTRKNITNVQLK